MTSKTEKKSREKKSTNSDKAKSPRPKASTKISTKVSKKVNSKTSSKTGDKSIDNAKTASKTNGKSSTKTTAKSQEKLKETALLQPHAIKDEFANTDDKERVKENFDKALKKAKANAGTVVDKKSEKRYAQKTDIRNAPDFTHGEYKERVSAKARTRSNSQNNAKDDFFKKLSKNLEVKTPENPLEPMKLADLSQDLQDACERAGWKELMPVQSHTLPYILARQDMMIQSRTGSGKTGAYLIPTYTHLDPTRKECQALIIVPTRELAIQVEQEARHLFHAPELKSGNAKKTRGTKKNQEINGALESSACDVAQSSHDLIFETQKQEETSAKAQNQVRIVSVYGGVGYGKQLDALQKGAHIVIGTPGRILDHLLRRTLTLQGLRVLIFDEADRMLSIGFYPDMKEIQKYLPKKSTSKNDEERLLVNLFSATYPPRVLQLAHEFLHKPQMLSLSQGQVHVATSQHYYCECSSMEKDRTLVRILEKENPASAIIFCNTKANVHYVTSVLQGFGYNADALSADLSQSKREHVLRRLRSGDMRFLVATDVAARGIDIPDLSHVFLYEPPEDRESYIHRAGRTGRAGAAGTVISLVDIMQKLEIERIAKFYKMEILPMHAPTNEEIALISSERMLTLLEAKRRKTTGLELERAKRFLPLVHELVQHADEIEQAMLLALILDGEYQSSLFKKDTFEEEAPKLEKPQSMNVNRHFSRNKSAGRSHSLRSGARGR